MAYKTPNIDKIANDGILFTDAYGQNGCTAGRAAFITGQSPSRTGLLKVGLPGAPEGLHKKDPTIAELLKPLGYATGQFGKNHHVTLRFPRLFNLDRVLESRQKDTGANKGTAASRLPVFLSARCAR